MTKSIDANEVLTVAVAARRLGVSPFTVRSWLRQRRIPFFRLGRRIVIHAVDIDHFLAAHRIDAREAGSRERTKETRNAPAVIS